MAGGGVSEDGDAGFQIAPMVDVVFVLLLFFMASAGSQVIQKELTINLPSGGPSDRRPAINTIIIDVFPDGKVQVNNKLYDTPASKELPELKGWLQDTISKFGDKDPVIIRPDPQARQERIVQVLNACVAAKVTKLTFN